MSPYPLCPFMLSRKREKKKRDPFFNSLQLAIPLSHTSIPFCFYSVLSSLETLDVGFGLERETLQQQIPAR